MKKTFILIAAIVSVLAGMAQNHEGDDNTDLGGIPYVPIPLYWSINGDYVTESMPLSVGTTSPCSFRMKTNDTIRMFIDSTGRVGVGTEEPFQMLHVVGGNIMISKSSERAPGSTNGSIMFGGDVVSSNQHGNYAIEYVNSETEGYGLNFWKPQTGNTNLRNNILFLSDNYGRVGIGTNDPKAKLSVNGQILAKSVKVSTDAIYWPDYVFDADYPLIDIHDLEAYIEDHHHLPGVPSAGEIAEDGGFCLESMSAILLKKVEELTLYVIELQKKIEVLEKENE